MWSLKNFDKVICQHLQKSLKEVALYGDKKLSGSFIPKQSAKPMAISEYPEKSKYI